MTDNFPYVLFEIQNSLFAVSSKFVKSIVKLPEITEMPNYPEHIRGIINLRSQIVQIVDLRMMMGIKSINEIVNDFNSMMDQREQDHKNWLGKLEESVQNNEAFSLTTDPHKCAFGKWYDNYKTDSLILRDLLEKFDEPHRKIHSIAIEIEELKKQGDFDRAKEIIRLTQEHELAKMINLFAEVKKAYEQNCHELSIIIEDGGKRIGITVDKVISVQEIKEKEIAGNSSEIMNINNQKLIKNIAERKNDDSIIVVLDDNYILFGDKELALA